MNTKEREKARTAETRPLDRAVNMPLANTLKPMKTRAEEQMRFPVTASVAFRAKCKMFSRHLQKPILKTEKGRFKGL